MSTLQTPPSLIRDGHDRSVTYLRVSLTDRCNLRCLYCNAGNTFNLLPHEKILRYEEIYGLLTLLPAHGISKVRLTGGEPLVRRGVLPFLEQILALDLDIRLTTNGALLAPHAASLAAMGLKRVNISLDTLRREVFQSITGVDAFLDVRRAIDACLEAGVQVKINAVAMRGINDVDLPGFLQLASELPVEVRYIEFMPMGGGTAWREELFWPAADILEQAKRLADLEPLRAESQETAGPARRFALRGGKGVLGLISPMSNHFCGSCNRLRLTCDGRLRTCLYSDKEYRLRPILRNPKLGPEQAMRVMALATRNKPIGHEIMEAKRQAVAVCNKGMSGIGG
jgi:cyclic pyranopterin phosphate synthase